MAKGKANREAPTRFGPERRVDTRLAGSGLAEELLGSVKGWRVVSKREARRGRRLASPLTSHHAHVLRCHDN